MDTEGWETIPQQLLGVGVCGVVEGATSYDLATGGWRNSWLWARAASFSAVVCAYIRDAMSYDVAIGVPRGPHQVDEVSSGSEAVSERYFEQGSHSARTSWVSLIGSPLSGSYAPQVADTPHIHQVRRGGWVVLVLCHECVQDAVRLLNHEQRINYD